MSVHGALCGGLGVAIGVYSSLGGSGGHVNPAVTIYAVLAGRLGNGFKENLCGFLVYVSAQIVGMFLGAAVVYGVFDGQSYDYLSNGNLICLYATCPTEKFHLSTVWVKIQWNSIIFRARWFSIKSSGPWFYWSSSKQISTIKTLNRIPWASFQLDFAQQVLVSLSAIMEGKFEIILKLEFIFWIQRSYKSSTRLWPTVVRVACVWSRSI